MSEKLFHVRVDSHGGVSVNDHFSEDQLKEKFENAWWIKIAVDMGINARLEYFTPDTTEESFKVQRVS